MTIKLVVYIQLGRNCQSAKITCESFAVSGKVRNGCPNDYLSINREKFCGFGLSHGPNGRIYSTQDIIIEFNANKGGAKGYKCTAFCRDTRSQYIPIRFIP